MFVKRDGFFPLIEKEKKAKININIGKICCDKHKIKIKFQKVDIFHTHLRIQLGHDFLTILLLFDDFV